MTLGGGSLPYDPATGLPLTDEFLSAVNALLNRPADKMPACAAMFCVDVDRLRDVNTGAGRSAGDTVLAAVAGAVRASLGEKAAVCREAGDAFAAFVPEMEAAPARAAAEEIAKRASEGAKAASGQTISVSVGVAYYSADGSEAETLLSIARAACRKAYESGGAFQEGGELGPPEGPELLLDRLPCGDLVGREKEILSFRDRIEACRASAGYLFVRGDPGSGRTRLLREFHRVCRADGTASALSSCSPADALRPYSSLVRALVAYADERLDSPGELVRGRSSAEMEHVAPLFARYGFPILPGAQSGTDGAGRKLPDESEDFVSPARRRTVFEALLRIARELARPEPVVFLFDDVQWLDEATVELFRYVERERPFGLLVAGTLNDLGLRDGTGELRPAAALAGSPGTNLWQTRLERLTPEESARMTTAILSGRRESSELDQAIYRFTAGSPGMLEGILRLLAMRRQVAGSGPGWTVQIVPSALPRTLEALIDATVGEIDADLAEAASAAAAAGEAVGVQALGEAIGRSDAEVMGFIDDLLRLRLFETVRPGGYEIAPASTHFAERIVAAAGEDYLDVVHGAYADRAARARPAGLASAGEEAYHRGLSADASAAAAALEEAELEAATVYRRPGARGAGAAGVDAFRFGAPPRAASSGQRRGPDRAAPPPALGTFLETFADALEAVAAISLGGRSGNVARTPEVKNLVLAFEPLAQDTKMLTLDARADSLEARGEAAGSGEFAEAAARVYAALRGHGVATLSLGSGLTVEEAAILVEALAKEHPPPDWNAFLEAKGVQRISVAGASFPRTPAGPRERPRRRTVRKARFETHPDLSAEAKALRELEEREGLAGVVSRDHDGARDHDETPELGQALESLGPEHVSRVEGIPPGADPIRVSEGDAAGRVLRVLDDLLAENDRATAAAVIWRVLASFELEKGEGRKALVSYMEDLEPRIWRTRLAEAYKALEDTIVRELRREKRLSREGDPGDDELLDLLTRSAGRAMREFLRAGQYTRLERVARTLSTMGPDDDGDEKCLSAATRSLERLSRTDFFDVILSDLASDSPERSGGALAALKPMARAVKARLVDIVRTTEDYRLRSLAAEGLAAAGEEGGLACVAQLGPTTPDDEYERIVSVLDVLELEPEVAEEAVVQAINYASDGVRRAAVSVVYRLPLGSALGVLQKAINEGGTLGALRTVQAIGELRLVEAMPIVQKQMNDSQDASVIEAAARAIGRMAADPDVPALRAVRLLEGTIRRLPELADKEEAERAALTALWALDRYDIPEVIEAVRQASEYPSMKAKTLAKKMLERAKKEDG